MANHAKFVNPSVLSWQLSGELLAMVILGSASSLIGPILGAAFFLAFRDVLSDYTSIGCLLRAAARGAARC